MAQFVNANGGAPDSATIPAGLQAGDLIVVFAFRNTTTAPSLATGYTNITSGSGNSCAYRVGYLVAAGTETTTGTWTNATVVNVAIWRGFSVGAVAGATKAASTSGSAPALTLQNTSGSSWVVAMVGSRQTTSESTPTSMQLRATQTGTTSFAITTDTGAGVTSWAAHTSTLGSSVTSCGISLELLYVNTAPSVPTLISPTTTVSTTTPTLSFTTTDAQGDNITYEVELDTVSTFDSQ